MIPSKAHISINLDIDSDNWQALKTQGMSEDEIKRELLREFFNIASHTSRLISDTDRPELMGLD